MNEKEKAFFRPLFLKCSVQNYEWGKRGEDSVVGRIFSLNSGNPIEEQKPYAEIWMGTHQSGASRIRDFNGGVLLKDWLDQNPEALGGVVVEKWGKDLPFLLKVLSVAQALSIQAHPDKKLALALHKERPDLYKDCNHKPEMALALTEFEALCGFVHLEELQDVLLNVPEVIKLVGEVCTAQLLAVKCKDQEKLKVVLQSAFTQLMSANQDAISEMVSKMKSRLNYEKKIRELTDKEHLALRLEKQYPNDIGVISLFFLNYVKLSPGEALYLDANEPHAYIHGDCIECMATSDNVVRAGLTPKYRDVQTLCSMLTYKQGFPHVLRGTEVNKYTRRYSPPFDEFEVDRCCLPYGASVCFPEIAGPTVFIILTGCGHMKKDSEVHEVLLKEGDVLFVPADTKISLTASLFGDDESVVFQLYKAGVNSRVFGKH